MNPKQATEAADEMKAEYDFETLGPGVRGKYADAFKGTSTTVSLDADVAKVFPDSEAVNQALRTLARVLATERKPAQP
jgi:hypothetical protein